MALHVIIGYRGQSVQSPAFPVYVGHDGSEAEKAMKNCTEAARFELFKGISGIRKSNPNYKPPGPAAPAESPDLVAEQQEAEAKAAAEAEAAAKAAEAAEAKAEAAAKAAAEAEAEAAEVQADEAPAEEAGALELQPTGKLTGKKKPAGA